MIQKHTLEGKIKNSKFHSFYAYYQLIKFTRNLKKICQFWVQFLVLNFYEIENRSGEISTHDHLVNKTLITCKKKKTACQKNHISLKT